MKLGLGSTNADPAQRFSISSNTVFSIFTTWIKNRASELKYLVYNPEKDVKKTLPQKPQVVHTKLLRK